MAVLWIGVVLVVLKWFEVGPFAGLSWWWVIAPLVAAAVWFEGLEKIFGRDRRQVESVEWERQRKERVTNQFQQPGGRR
jgi:small Trp-rich protein